MLNLGILAVLWVAPVTALFIDLNNIIKHGGIGHSKGTFEDRAKAILGRVPLVDGHNDLAWHTILAFKGHLGQFDLHNDSRTQFPYDPHNLAQTDIPRMRKGQLGAQFWSAYSSCKFQYTNGVTWGLTVIDVIKRMVTKYDDFMQWTDSADGIMAAFKNEKLASLIGLESGNMIGSNLAVLRMFYDLGVRYMTLTWSCDTPWADSYPDTRYNTPNHHGLTDFGKKVVREMNRLGMMVDLSHVAIDTMYDAINTSVAPVIFSHSSSLSICPHHRNVPDDVAKLLTKNDGIIMINFYPPFINCTEENKHVEDHRQASFAQVADHYDHFRNLIGSQYLGVGADFDGSGEKGELADTSTYPLLFAELLRRGWSESELEGVAYRNLYRVFKKVEQTRDTLRHKVADDSLIDRSDIPDLSCRSYPKTW